MKPPSRLGVRERNIYRIEDNAAILLLTTRGGAPTGETRISLCDLDRVIAEGKWFRAGLVWRENGKVRNRYPVAANSHIHEGQRRSLCLHRFVLSAPAGMSVDHINHDTLDNRRENLRLVTKAQNAQNLSGAHGDSKSGVRNVYWDAQSGRWHVQVSVGGKRTSFGTFATVEEAAPVAEAARRALQTHCPENSQGLLDSHAETSNA